MGLRIGIDTGGTFTDAVLLDLDRAEVLVTAKARTRADLSIGVGEALDRVLAEVPDGGDGISLVSLSTTLATNALVEGTRGSVALIFVGFAETEIDRSGLRRALGDAPVILVDGGHDSLGIERRPLDVDAVVAAAAELDVDAFAVSAQFSVRNPAHELAVRDALAPLGRPVACGHELSAGLNGPRRALTCVLNAGLIGLITDLCRTTRNILDARGVTAPLMIVRGDGSLVTADFAVDRPIETILSGPAASLIGAAWLTGRDELVVADIGGTTTDVGLVRRGRPRVGAEGATVGGHRTMVEAVEVHTTGLGGDSEVAIDTRVSPAGLTIGPRRITPLAVLALEEPDLVQRTLAGREGPFRPADVTFARAVGGRSGRPGPIGRRERAILDRLAAWRPVDEVATSNLEASTLRGLVGRGLVSTAGFTPTDAAHVLGLQADGDATVSTRAADLLAAASDGAGHPVRPDGKALARWVVDRVVRRSAEVVLEATLEADGLPRGTVDSPIVQHALDQRAALGRGHLLPDGDPSTAIRITPTPPLVGLGAGAATYHPPAAKLLDGACLVPADAEVAGAVGAAVGEVRITGRATVSQPTRGQYRVHLPDAGPDLGDPEPAIERAVALLSVRVRNEAERAGAVSVAIEVDVTRRTATVADRTVFVEATVTVVAAGPPGLG